MSTPATLLVVYLSIGLLLMTIALAAAKKGSRSETLAPAPGEEDPIGSGLFLLVVFLWPLWLVMELAKSEKRLGGEPTAKRDAKS